MTTRQTVTALSLVVVLTLAGWDTPWARTGTETTDTDAVETIRREGMSRSQVMQTAFFLTDVYGPRLTGSPQLRQAAEWTVDRLKRWGIDRGRIEEWGLVGRGWVNERFAAHAYSPHPWPVVGLPKAWTSGTDGPLIADAIYAPMAKDEDLPRWKGQLQGRIVLPVPTRELGAMFDAPARRFSASELEELRRGERVRPGPELTGAQVAFARRRLRFLIEHGALAVVEPSAGDGAIFVQHGAEFDPDRAPDSAVPPTRVPAPPQVVIAAEHYGRMVRLLGAGRQVRVELDIRNRFLPDQPGFNVIAELPGTDKAEEVVMIGAHLDSWHGATGATDNAVGVAVMLEVMRILKVSELPLRRTVRLALWSGEEQGLLGSRAYVQSKVAERETMVLKDEHRKISAYFNLDNGTGAIRGVYLQGNGLVAPVFAAWMQPFAELGVATLSATSTFSTDHLSFDEVGIPAFQFIQDPIEYDTRTHHSNTDTYERIQADDAIRNAVIVASFVYHAANRDEPLPRKALPSPRIRSVSTP
jgi:carboxypeptidase Q